MSSQKLHKQKGREKVNKKLLAGLAAGLLVFNVCGSAQATIMTYSDTFANFASGSDNTFTPMSVQYETTGLNIHALSEATLSFDILADMGNSPEWLTISANGIDFVIKEEGVEVGDILYDEQHFEYSLTMDETIQLVGGSTVSWNISFAGVADFGPDSPVFTQYPQEYITFNLTYDALDAQSSDSTAPVPEPATMLLFGTGLVGLAGRKLRKATK